MDLRLIIELSIFVLLVLWHLSDQGRRLIFLKRKFDENIIDILSLSIQGILIPFLQFILIFHVFETIIPSWKNSLHLSEVSGFLINFVVIDFFYFLVHRSMHSDFLWGLHLIHHSSKEMDVVVSSRNSVWTSFFFPYLWLNSLFLFLLDNKVGFVLGVSMTAMLDLWRHSYLTMNPSSTLYKFTSLILHTPIHHSWHHSRSRSRVNFGANISIWDRLFGTYYHSQEFPKDLGFDVKGDLKTKLFHPFKLREENQ